jgi:hypothetical protein
MLRKSTIAGQRLLRTALPLHTVGAVRGIISVRAAVVNNKWSMPQHNRVRDYLYLPGAHQSGYAGWKDRPQKR